MATSISRGTSSKPTKPPPPQSHTSPTSTSTSSTKTTSSTTSSSLSSHLAMVELKHRILASLSKLSDRDTQQIAVEDLEKIIRTLPTEGVPMLLNALLHDPPVAIAARRECLRLLSLLCSTHPDAASAHLPKIIAHVVRRVKDSSADTSIRDACRDAAGTLSALYLRPAADAAGENYASVVALFVKPLLEAMGEQNKGVQAGAAACLSRVVECAGGGGCEEEEEEKPPLAAAAAVAVGFQKLCPRICKFLGGQSFLAKGALLSVVSSLSQVGAIPPQSMQSLLHSIRECLENSDWAIRKAAADTLCVLASHSSHLISDGTASITTVLEACRFDKVKPVRDSMTEALVLWKKIMGKGADGNSDDRKDSKSPSDHVEYLEHKGSNSNDRRSESAKDSSAGSSPTSNSLSKNKGSSIAEKAVVLLKKKTPSLSDKDLNPEFFQKLETRSSDDLPVEVVVPRRCTKSSHLQGDEELESDDGDSRSISCQNGTPCFESNNTPGTMNINHHNTDKRGGTLGKVQDSDDFARDKWAEQRVFKARDPKARTFDIDDRVEVGQKDPSGVRAGVSRIDGHSEGSFMNNRGNWLAIQRQLSQLERQQASLMNMLQDFMGGSHDSMITLENRVRGLERVVEEMARDLALSSGRRSSMMMGFEGSPGRSSSKFNGFSEYSNSKFGRGSEGRMPFAERFLSSDGMVSGVRGREPPWRSDAETWDSYAYAAPRNGLSNSKRVSSTTVDGRLPRPERDGDQAGNRRAWDKGAGPFRLGEGPSARSVWQASKDEATLEAIRVAGDDSGTSRTATQVATRELDAEALGDDNQTDNRGPLWASWTHAMDALHVGDVDSAYAEVLSTGDDLLLVKLMDRSGPAVDQLSNEIAGEILHALGQFLLEQSLLDIALSWIQQLADLVIENGADFLGIQIESKREILLNLHEASAMEPPEDWEGATAEQMMLQLALAWGIDIQQLVK